MFGTCFVGAYNAPSYIGSSPGKTLTPRRKAPYYMANDVPGPGAYKSEVGSVKTSAPSYSMRARTAVPTAQRNVPGPGKTIYLHTTTIVCEKGH